MRTDGPRVSCRRLRVGQLVLLPGIVVDPLRELVELFLHASFALAFDQALAGVDEALWI